MWCCGWTCWDNSIEEGGVKGEDGDGGCEKEGEGKVPVEMQVELLEKMVDRPLRGVCRDEWECDFCGAECFCEWILGK